MSVIVDTSYFRDELRRFIDANAPRIASLTVEAHPGLMAGFAQVIDEVQGDVSFPITLMEDPAPHTALGYTLFWDET